MSQRLIFLSSGTLWGNLLNLFLERKNTKKATDVYMESKYENNISIFLVLIINRWVLLASGKAENRDLDYFGLLI